MELSGLILDYDKPEPIYNYIDSRIDSRKESYFITGGKRSNKKCDKVDFNSTIPLWLKEYAFITQANHPVTIFA